VAYRDLGRSGPKVSAFGLGNLGAIDTPISSDLIKAANAIHDSQPNPR
jgi:hypothetical protein